MAVFEFYREQGAKPYKIEAETKEDAQAVLFENLTVKGRESDFNKYMTREELAQQLRNEGESIQKAGTAPYLEQDMTTGEKIAEKAKGIVKMLFPATMSVSENEDSGIAKKIVAGIIDVAANAPIGRGVEIGVRAGEGALGAVRGILGSGAAKDIAAQTAIGTAQGAIQGQDIGQAAKTSGMIAGGFRGALGAGRLAKDMGPKGFANFSGALSGASPEAIEAYAKGGKTRKQIVEAAGSTPDVTKTFIEDVTNPALTSTDKPEVVEALKGIIVDIDPVIQKLKSMKEVERDVGMGLSSSQKKFNEAIDRKISDLSPTGETRINANAARIQRAEELDRDPVMQFGTQGYDPSISGKLRSALKEARKTYAQLLVDNARPEYKGAMESWAKKIQTREKMLEDLRLGDDPDVIRRNAEKVLANLFGKNKTAQQDALREFDDVFGSDYVENLKNAYYANQLGINKGVFKNQPSILPMQTTGARNTGIELIKLGGAGGIGAGAASMMGAPAGVSAAILPLVAAGWSPYLATKTLGAWNRVGQNPAARGLGFLSGFAKNPAQNIARENNRK